MSARVKGRSSATVRQSEILRRIYTAGHVSVSALSQEFAVSSMTVRRDLRALSEQELLSMVHGGATVRDGTSSGLAFPVRATREAAAKRRIGEVAAAGVGVDEVIGVDAGTTALEVALHLPENFAGTVISHSIPVLAAMLTRPAVCTVGLGGDLLPLSGCLLSGAGVALASSLRLDHLFLGVSAVNAQGIYVHSTLELDMKRALMQAADRVTLVCDRSKLGAAGAVWVSELDGLFALITNAGDIEVSLAAALDAAGVRMILTRVS